MASPTYLATGLTSEYLTKLFCSWQLLYIILFKILSRGTQIKLSGAPEQIDIAKEKIELVIQYMQRNGHLSENYFEQILGNVTDVRHTREYQLWTIALCSVLRVHFSARIQYAMLL